MPARAPAGGEPGGAVAVVRETTDAASDSKFACTRQLRASPRFRRLIDHLHRLGPRPVGELLIAVATAHGIEGDILARLEQFGELDPATVAAIEARDWPPLPRHEVQT